MINDWIPYYSAGDVLRGVLSDQLRATQMLSLSVDLPIRIMDFLPSKWTGIRGLGIFDCEIHFSPFADLALLEGPLNRLKKNIYDGTRFEPDDIVSTVGLEVIAFSYRFRSIRLRGSVGYNLRKMIEEGPPPLKWGFFPQWDEIFIGLDHEY
jgi:hypothetical protein